MSYIDFPKLGIELSIDRVAFRIFGIPVYWYGIFIALGFVVAIIVAFKQCKKFGIKQETIIDGMLYATPVAIIFARIYYVVLEWDEYKDNLLEIFNIRKGGLALFGVLIGAFLTAYVYLKIKKLPFLKTLDFCIVYFPLVQSIGRWGNFVNQEVYGIGTELPWGMTGSIIGDLPVHPLFLYEAIWNMALFFLLLWFRKRKKFDGEIVYLYIIFYGIGRAWMELLRDRQFNLMLGDLKINSLIAGAVALLFLILLVIKRRKSKTAVSVAAGSSEYGYLLKDDDTAEMKSEASYAAQTVKADKDEADKTVADESESDETAADKSDEPSGKTNI